MTFEFKEVKVMKEAIESLVNHALVDGEFESVFLILREFHSIKTIIDLAIDKTERELIRIYEVDSKKTV